MYKKHEICFCLLLLFFSRGLKFPRSHLTVVFFFFDVLRLERTLVFSRCFFNFGAQNYCFYPLQEVPGGPQGKILNCFFFLYFLFDVLSMPKNKSKNKVLKTVAFEISSTKKQTFVFFIWVAFLFQNPHFICPHLLL